MILALLVVPVWLLYKFSDAGTITTSPDSIIVIFMFTLVFCAMLSAFTRAKRHEILAASAGLVVWNSLTVIPSLLFISSTYKLSPNIWLAVGFRLICSY